MNIGKIEFVDGDVIQGWNPSAMSPVVRKQIAMELINTASHMLNDEFLEGEGDNEKWVKRKYQGKARKK